MIKVGVGDYAVLDILPGEYAQIADIATLFDVNFLKRAFSKFAEIELNLKYSLNPENLFESACLTLLDDGAAQVNTVAQSTQRVATNNVKPTQTVQLQPVQEAEPQATVQPTAPVQKSETDRVWGNVLIKVRENNLFALSNALTSVFKVEEINKRLILHTNDLSSRDLIDNKDKLDVLLKLVNLFDESITKIEVMYDKQNASTQDIKDNLKEIFKSKIKFKE